MSNKVKLYIHNADAETHMKIKTIIKEQIDFELCDVLDELELHCTKCGGREIESLEPKTTSGNAGVTQAARVMNEWGSAQANALAKRISDIFITVGIPAHIKGYQFLREAIRLAIEQPGIINCITKQLYPCVAKRFQTTPSKVERAIRHAIEVGWSRGKIENINNIFGVKVYGQHDRPTNGEFIALVADKMLIDGVC